MEKNLDQIHQEALAALEAAQSPEAVEELSIRYLGRKGVLTRFLRNISQLPADQRPAAGKKANELKKVLDRAFRQALEKQRKQESTGRQGIDVSLPGRRTACGAMHPITLINEQMCSIFSALGFDIAEGPEVESDYYNFEALNFPKDHPARDMQDIFFINGDTVLRTHTSPLQIRIMEKQSPPVRIIMPGKVYRCDSDLTHTPMFHQVEGLLVDEGISFGDLKGILTAFIHRMFDDQTSLRFRPSFFPFTEPSAEVLTPAGLRSLVREWCIRHCMKMWGMIPGAIPALLLGWGWNASPCSSTGSMIFAGFLKMTCVFWRSFKLRY